MLKPVPALPIDAALYRRLADHYLHAIERGVLKEGDRMPSVRALMRMHGVSLSTALLACRHLEARGWLEAQPRRGYFVRRSRRALLPAATEVIARVPPDPAAYVGIHAKVSAFVATTDRHHVSCDLAMAVCAPELYPARALQTAALRVLRQRPELMVAMPRHGGHPPFQAALARRLLERGANHVAPDEFIVTHGCVQSLNLALRAVCEPGDTVAVESPTYYGMLQVIESLGLKALELPTSPHTGLNLDALAFALSEPGAVKAVLCMPNLHNPLGSVMPDAHKARLVELCARHDVPLIEDDIYAELGDDAPLKPLKAWDRTGQVIHCSSFNKVLGPGLRIGWMLAGRWHERVAMLKYAQSRYVEELPQRIGAAFLAGGGFDRHLHRLRAALRDQREQVADAVAASFPEGTRLSVPAGGMVLWVELPRGLSSQRLFEAALAQGIRLVPGSQYSNGDRYDHFIRLSCGRPLTAPIREAVMRVGALASRAVPGAAAA